MAIALILQFEGTDSAKYDAVQETLGLADSGSVWPEGLISHVAGHAPQGWCVIDVWESQAHFDRFFAERLKAAFDTVSGLSTPRITPVEIHNIYQRG
jgi:hypothetical protein